MIGDLRILIKFQVSNNLLYWSYATFLFTLSLFIQKMNTFLSGGGVVPGRPKYNSAFIEAEKFSENSW